MKRIAGLTVLAATCLVAALPARAQAPALPADIVRQLPAGHEVMTAASSDFNGDGKVDHIVVVQSRHGKRRPLLAFIQVDANHYRLDARNDAVVYAADEGGQCDPFMDGEEGLVAKGAFFTVQNAVACGSHWTDYITFRYSAEVGHFIFHKRIFESLVFNPSNDPQAEALIPGRRSVTPADKKKPILLSRYQPQP